MGQAEQKVGYQCELHWYGWLNIANQIPVSLERYILQHQIMVFEARAEKFKLKNDNTFIVSSDIENWIFNTWF